MALPTSAPQKPFSGLLHLAEDHAPTCDGEYFVPSLTSTQASSDASAFTILYGTSGLMTSISGSPILRPIKRFAAYKVLSGFVTAWRLACKPTNLEPSSVRLHDRRRGARAFRVLDDARGCVLP